MVTKILAKSENYGRCSIAGIYKSAIKKLKLFYCFWIAIEFKTDPYVVRVDGETVSLEFDCVLTF